MREEEEVELYFYRAERDSSPRRLNETARGKNFSSWLFRSFVSGEWREILAALEKLTKIQLVTRLIVTLSSIKALATSQSTVNGRIPLPPV